MSEHNPTTRFTSRVDDYIRYRPGYPPQVIELLVQEYGLNSASLVADIGAGTGILTALLLQQGCQVIGIEPNDAMRMAAEDLLAGFATFRSMNGTAEHTGLPDTSIDIITAGQAFHWFDQQRTRGEFARILRPDGWVVLLWNDRRLSGSPFLEAYEQLLRTYGTDYAEVNHTRITSENRSGFFTSTNEPFFAPGSLRQYSFPNYQIFDFDGLRGRHLSSSFVPDAAHPNYAPMMLELERIFHTYEIDGTVRFEYDTLVYAGRIAG